ncbi:MAG: hypothetical protein BroJett011_46740 [Chloroflexota bacterium]|nr:MAG: hypothetical protein BroJett011_46740 [Chloroflexota bacterium]
MYDLLALSARARCEEGHYRLLAQRLSQFTGWLEVPTYAELHGLGPLCYFHWQATAVPIPITTRLALRALYLRHCQANEVRLRVLAEILAAYQAAGIQALVLKGAALACLVYPEPGLRPMRDLDLLVKKSEVRRAHALLAELGFVVPRPPDQRLPSKHLAAATRQTDGFLISVEVHHNLFSDAQLVSLELDNLTVSPLPFALGANGFTAYTLGYEDMLWHLCQHFILNAGVFAAHRLIWVADIISLAEHFAAEIDWARIEKQYPLVLNTLSLLHFLTPLSERLLVHARLKPGKRPPAGIGLDFQGWPHSGLTEQRQKGYRRILRDTFWPSEWWLRLYYGLGSIRPVFWQRWIGHPLYILRLAAPLLLKRVKYSILKPASSKGKSNA